MKLKLPKLFSRKKKQQKASVEAPTPPPEPKVGSVRSSYNPLTYNKSDVRIVGIISGKGGCGKTTIAVNMATLASALHGSVVVVDLDILNASTTQMFQAVDGLGQAILTAESNVLTILTRALDSIAFLKINLREFGHTIQVHGNPDLGVSIKTIYLLPARRFDDSIRVSFYTLSRMSPHEYREKLRNVLKAAENIARRSEARLVIVDFPPLKADTRMIGQGVFEALNYVTDVLAITEAQPGTAQGLVDLLPLYPAVKGKLRAYVVNSITEYQEAFITPTINTIRSRVGTKIPIFVIPHDERWGMTSLLPMTLGDPGKGAHLELIKMMVELGFIEKEVVKKKLNLDV